MNSVCVAPRGGTLYACGCTNGKQQNFIPVKGADSAGHCPYPDPVVLPKGLEELKFVAAAADMGLFAALTPDGVLVAWGVAHKVDFPAHPTPLATGVTSFDVGARFVACVDRDGVLTVFGSVNGAWPSRTIAEPVKLTEHTFVAVAACGESLLALAADGSCHALGDKVNAGLQDSSPTQLVPLEGAPRAKMIALGSRHGALISADDELYVWGDGLSGALGDGKRHVVATPRAVLAAEAFGVDAGTGAPLHPVHVACTRGQPDCKRVRTKEGISPGQEGQRTHVVTNDGGLWVAGTTHKGLAGDHLHKTMQPAHDHLTFYRVGGRAADARHTPVPTGAAEDLGNAALAAVVARRMGMGSTAEFGKGGCTNYLTEARIVASQPAHIHSWAMSSDGRAFCWGCGSDGRTGLRGFMRGPGGSKRTMKCYVSTPSCVEALEERRVTAMASGRWWTLFIVD